MPLDITTKVGEVVRVPLAAIDISKIERLRNHRDPVIIQQLAEALDNLPPIEVNQNFEALDGWYRWKAHEKAEATEIAVFITPTADDIEIVEIFGQRNGRNASQLTKSEKIQIARKIYNSRKWQERVDAKAFIADLFGVHVRTVENWVHCVDIRRKVQRDQEIVRLYNERVPFRQIAALTGVSHDTAFRTVQRQRSENLRESDSEDTETDDPWWSDFTPPLTNVWHYHGRGQDFEYECSVPPKVTEALAYFYTKPNDIICDPFGGSGSTNEICQRRGREPFVTDRKPARERNDIIKTHDLNEGLPPVADWNRVGLVFLDPPYSHQAAGRHSDDAEDWANIPVEQFHDNMVSLILGFAFEITNRVIPPLRLENHIAVPYAMTRNDWVFSNSIRRNRQMLLRNRDLIVFQIV
jgi:ParB-like chromosome segregation protein Spo0J